MDALDDKIPLDGSYLDALIDDWSLRNDSNRAILPGEWHIDNPVIKLKSTYYDPDYVFDYVVLEDDSDEGETILGIRAI